ncbi:hypothetical protein DOT_3222 [Desulfosporosinus sp. OT]|nr:hypothetical protein DOT_3222 [Desulfosporosinus sp. OT]
MRGNKVFLQDLFKAPRLSSPLCKLDFIMAIISTVYIP